LERNWRRWKKRQSGERKMETIIEEEKIKEENLKVREWTEENDNEIGNMTNPYYKL